MSIVLMRPCLLWSDTAVYDCGRGVLLLLLQKRASEAVELKGVWWNQRKAAAEEAISTAPGAKPFAALPLPKWQLGKPVALDELKKVCVWDGGGGGLE
jgi:hypothetical protein